MQPVRLALISSPASCPIFHSRFKVLSAGRSEPVPVVIQVALCQDYAFYNAVLELLLSSSDEGTCSRIFEAVLFSHPQNTALYLR